MPHSAIASTTRKRAQHMRRAPTDAERKLWWVLRSLRPLGIHFRRQAPIGEFIADFAWHQGRLVIGVDGSQHVEMRSAYDEKRSRWLRSQGYRVLRFWNNDVLKTPRAVAEAILAAARQQQDATLNRSPRGGGEHAFASCKEPVIGQELDPTPDPSPQLGGESALANLQKVAMEIDA